MKVIFLDFDGVLNSEASFRHEIRRKNSRVSDTLSVVACSNLQYILEQDSAVKIVISSSWRNMHSLQQLRDILSAYGITGTAVIGKTPSVLSGDRGHEINLWLADNPNVTKFVVIDDDNAPCPFSSVTPEPVEVPSIEQEPPLIVAAFAVFTS